MRKIAVCIKQIPLVEDTNFDPVTRTIRRDGVNVISAYDLRAIAQAVDLKNRFGAETVVVTMGPPQAREALTDALGMGLDRAVHLQDRAFAGADTLATARALALWLKREAFDLIMLGKYSLDAETGQVGPEIAELLGIAQITGVRTLELDGDRIRAERESDEGLDQVEALMPALLTCAERLINPIKIDPKTRAAAQSMPIETVTAAQLTADAAQLGLAGSPTWVQEVRAQESPKVHCTMIDAADPELAAERVIAALESCGALKPRVHRRRPIAAPIRPPARGKDVWVAVESDLAGAITLGSLELLSAADRLATQLGGAVIATGLSADIARHAGLIASYGADRIIIPASPALASYSPDSAAAAIADLVRDRAPWGLLLCASERGRDWGPRLAARMGLGLTGDAIGLELDGENRMVALKPAFGGNIVAPILSKTYPQAATVRQGVLELAEPNPARRAAVETVALELAAPLTRTVNSVSSIDHSVAPLDGAEVVVGIGMGVGGPEGVAVVKDFARTLGAAICATRRVTDKGWVAHQLQVGLTGKAIAPRLYFSVGIRGVPNHTVGIKRAETIVAINNDPDAVIFERANFGLVGDWQPLTRALIAAFQRRNAA
ncbi:MAG: electron transfer flavoprotein alpha/ beta subunit [Candidatus Binataceae bacterium]|nr:electron transfer flavoprotein alpha/ beta subunit [Candidatus Binataceae bacterium]